jgi:aryl-alcohol dehydrogenase-like predicted oxidoreductase
MSWIFPIAPFAPVIRERAHASARRLQLDSIPLYHIHQANPVNPAPVIMPGTHSVLEAGDIGDVGVSNYSLAR